jgi:hypothetical protein
MLSFFLSLTVSEQRIMSAFWNKDTQSFTFTNTYDDSAAARAIYSNDQNATGWYNLQVEGDRITDNIIESRASGILEGRLTHELFKKHRSNVYAHICDKYVNCNNGKIPDNIYKYFQQNYDWVESHLEGSPADDPFFFAARMTFAQFNGLVEGYNMENPSDPITKYDLWMYMAHPLIIDLSRINSIGGAKEDAPQMPRRGTAVVGQSSSVDNVFIGQSAWRHYGESIRLAKRYRIRYNTSDDIQIADRRTLSSYPFMIHSDDEFTISDQGLVIVSSSLTMSKEKLATVMPSVQGLPYWLRNIAATLASHSASEWKDYYFPLSSTGTGIEYLIVDIKKFVYKDTFQKEFIFVVDEIPLMIDGRDVTEHFLDKRFFGSYDVPFLQTIYNAAGYKELAASNPAWYSYNESNRARILQVNAQTFYDDNAMKTFIRKNDPEMKQQEGSPFNAISGRAELLKDPEIPMCFGAYDAKYTTIPRILHSQWVGQVGATRDSNLPPLILDTNSVCKDEARDGVDTHMYNDWADHYFDIEIE